jgi:hypothetical protein
VLLVLLRMMPVRPRRRLRVDHSEAMIDHSSDNERNGPLIGIGEPLQSVMHFGRDPGIAPDFESIFLHGHARPCSADAG